jgi:CDP-paratose 2-epimerase
MTKTKTALITGSCGLIGSEVVRYFSKKDYSIIGIDSNHRAVFFGPDGDTSWTLKSLAEKIKGYVHHNLDIREREKLFGVIEEARPDIVIHTAAQPSHDKAAAIPFLDFEINALGTLNLLEATRQYCKDAPFIHMSTNKVYGDRPNTIEMVESETRWDFGELRYANGIAEDFPIDQSKHSLFGASKLAADVLVQEYGRYFGMPTCVLRGGCLTGPGHSGVELHGFLSYLVKCNVLSSKYRIHGYRGKQVRDNIHSHDVASFMFEFVQSPRCGEVYNLGGGKENSCSILEAFDLAKAATGNPMQWEYCDEARLGDHICYYSDLRKIKSHYPRWTITKSLKEIISEIAENWAVRGLVL